MSSDPTSWDDEKLMQHALLWCDLPPLTGISRTMTDQDVRDHSDMMHIRNLVDELATAKAELHQECRDFAAENGGQFPVEAIMWLQYLCHGAELLPHTTFKLSPSWDEALQPLVDVGELLAVWRSELDGEVKAA